MSDILVRGLNGQIIHRLKMAAKQHGRSLQGEAKAILTEAVPYSSGEALKTSAQWRKKFAGRKFSDSTKLIRADRDR